MRLLEHAFAGAVEDAIEANRLLGDFDSSLRLRLFDARWASGDYSKARDLLDLPHDRKGFDYLVRQARILDRLGDTEAARDNLARALDQVTAYAEPASVAAWVLTELGHFEAHARRPKLAAVRYLESLEMLPGNPAAFEGLGRLAAGVDHNHAGAAVLFARSLREGAHLDLHLEFASAQEALGEHHKASLARARFIERATATPRRLSQYLRPLALVLADHYPDRLPEALGYAERDLAQRPTLESWDTLAWVRYRSGDIEGALAASRHATSWGVPEPIVFYHSGVIADEAGARERADRFLEAALTASTELTMGQVKQIEMRLDP